MKHFSLWLCSCLTISFIMCFSIWADGPNGEDEEPVKELSFEEQKALLEADIQRLERKKKCVNSAAEDLSDYSGLMEQFMGGDQNNIIQVVVNAKQPRTFFKNNYLAFLNWQADLSPGSAEQFGTDMTDLKNRIENIRENIAQVSQTDQQIIKYLGAARVKMVQLKDKLIPLEEVKKTQNYCNLYTVQKNYNGAIETLENWIDFADSYRVYLVSSRNKMISSMDGVGEKVRSSYESKIIRDLDESLFEIWQQAKMVNGFERATDQLLELESHLSKRGMEDGQYSTFLQYQSSLDVILRNIETANVIKKQISAYSHRLNVTLILARVEAILIELKFKKAKIEKLGWTGVRNRQIELSQARLKNDEVSDECRKATEKHLTESQSVVTLGDFSELQKYYKQAVQSCKR